MICAGDGPRIERFAQLIVNLLRLYSSRITTLTGQRISLSFTLRTSMPGLATGIATPGHVWPYLNRNGMYSGEPSLTLEQLAAYQHTELSVSLPSSRIHSVYALAVSGRDLRHRTQDECLELP